MWFQVYAIQMVFFRRNPIKNYKINYHINCRRIKKILSFQKED